MTTFRGFGQRARRVSYFGQRPRVLRGDQKVSVGYETVEELDELLLASDYEREPLPYVAGFAAGKAFLRYRRGGGDKRSPMPDFCIGAHAAVAGYRL
jgi:predicted nucleic acid-binding protein